MQRSLNSYTKPILIFLFYFLIIRGISILLYQMFGDYLVEKGSSYFSLIDTFNLLICLGITFLYVRKSSGNISLFISKDFQFSLKSAFLIIFLTILYRLFIDPVFRVHIITGEAQLTIPDSNGLISENFIHFLNMVIFTSILEEVVFRRIILENLIQTNKAIVAILGSSILFSLDHINILSPYTFIPIINAFLISMVLGIVYLRYGLLYSILFHSAFNFWSFLLNGYRIEYWNVLKELNFGVIYWAISIMSLAILIIYSCKMLKAPSKSV